MIWLLICFAAGVASACGFAPLNLWPLTLAGVALLIAAVESAPRLRTALARGWWFGFGQFALGLNWIATAFTYQSNMPAWLGWVAVVLLSLYLAIFPALAAGLAWRWGRSDRLRMVLILAAAWIVTEFLRAVLFTGFPWNPLGISLLLTPALIFAALAGTYALGGLAVLTAGIPYLLARRAWRQGAALAAAVLALVGAAWLVTPPPPATTGPPVRIVQPNVSQGEKHGDGYEPVIRRRLATLTSGPPQTPRLVLWPEDAMPYILDEDDLGRLTIARWLGERDLLLTGGAKIERDADGWPLGARNSVYLMGADGQLQSRYDKAHLVPWGEYLPLRSLMESIGLSRVVPGGLDFWEGPGPQTLPVPGYGHVGVQICYEIVFSGQIVDRQNRPDFLYNPSNDAWFGWWGPPQHFAQARLRAAEEGLPVLRSTPTGVSGIIGARGQVLGMVPLGQQGVVDAPLPPPAPPTIFSRLGNLAPFIFATLLVLVAGLLARLQSRSNTARERAT